MFRLVTKAGDVKSLYGRMASIFEECVIEAFTEWAKKDDEYLRANDGFIDRTGNLRSSLGAAVIRDGKVEFVTPFATVLKGVEGSRTGRNTVESLAASYQGLIAKVMVAGMDYAQKVEDIESKDVLESRRIQCEQEAQKVMESAIRKAEKRFKMLK